MRAILKQWATTVKDGVRNGLKQTRMRLRLSQQDLATMAGVSRQTIGGVESGQTSLSITVALRLARALGCRVEDLFWLDADAAQVEAIPTQAMPSGEPVPVSLAKIAGRWVAHPLVGPDAFRLDLIPADGETLRHPEGDRVTVTLLDDPVNLLNTVVVAGCSPSLSLWTKAAERWHPGLRVHLTFANSAVALERLMRGEAHIAGLHLYCPKTRTFNVPFVQQQLRGQTAVLINLGIWQEGMVVASGNPKGIHTVADLARADVRLINRELGSGSRSLLEQVLAQANIDPQTLAGFQHIAPSHQAVAEAIQAGTADVGISAASVARMFSLGFVPLRRSHYDLVTFQSYLDEPPVQQLLSTLGHRRVLSQLERLGGYDTCLTGEEVATVAPLEIESG
jgi:putative molybdopterin biosynthesis protein